ncbi:hypothetical protein ACJX0J_016969, partial [Zea mays]
GMPTSQQDLLLYVWRQMNPGIKYHYQRNSSHEMKCRITRETGEKGERIIFFETNLTLDMNTILTFTTSLVHTVYYKFDFT